MFAQIKEIKYFKSVSKTDLKTLTDITYICDPKLCRLKHVLTERKDVVAVQLQSSKDWEL